ncbi:MAG: GNAT family N-acyltransferase [Fodinibius sp.]|nr:GNAT family N-acyltransferase [Fodinibius sp.]
MDNDLPSSLASSNRYNVRLAKTEEDLRAAQSLRYRVFNLELGEGLAESHKRELDVDKYDSQCDHLLVVELATDTVIGTYRMQTYEKARQHHGFYTDDEFDLSVLPSELLDESVEVGRACIGKEHRNGRVLYLLWRGIAEYMKLTSSRYLFGCCSIASTDPQDGWVVMDYLRHNGHMHHTYYLDTKPPFSCPEVERDQDSWRDVDLPQLFCLYLDLDAKALSKPALDRDFRTIDFLILVDVEELDERSRALFFK